MRRAVLPVAFSALILLSSAAIKAQTDSSETRVVPEARAYRVNPHPPVIDGSLDDPIWKADGLDLITEFTQRLPDDGEAITESTTVAIAYDDEALYVAFWCYDREPDKIDRILARRDRYTDADKVSIRLDSYHDHLTGFMFEVSAAGVQRDFRYYNDDWSDGSWDAVWTSDVRPTAWGWTAEMKIPYHCLRFTQADEQVWGMDIRRVINRKNEYQIWSYYPRGEAGYVSHFGHLTGLHGIKPTGHLEVLPYVVSNVETEPKRLGNIDGKDFTASTGVDIKYAVTSELTLDATVNPDFGQVELDAPVLNLTAYETYYPERRPFFVEGSNIFETEFNMFYSRRIGRPPRYGVDDDDYIASRHRPAATTILGAAKLSGKLGGKTSIGFLNAVTEEEKQEYLAGTNWDDDLQDYRDTVSRSQTVEPLGNYSVLRVERDLSNGSTVGGLLTVASREKEHPAVTGSLDGAFYTGKRDYSAEVQVVFSRVDPSVTGYGWDLMFQKNSGKHIRGTIGATFVDRYLDLNDLGFLSSNNRRTGYLWVQYRTQDPWWIIRESYNNINFQTGWDYEGYNNNFGGNINGYMEFVNYWGFNWGVSLQTEKYSTTETRGNGVWIWPVYPTYSLWCNIDTDSRKSISGGIGGQIGTDRGGRWHNMNAYANYRPRSNIELSLSASYNRSFGGTRFVANPGDGLSVDRSLFADLDQDRVSISGSLGYVVTRNLTIQLSAEGYMSGLNYRKYRFYDGDDRYSDPLTDQAVDDNGYDSDGNYTALNSTLLMRWEYMPGSTMYLVWTRSRPEWDSGVNDLKLSRDFDRFFSSGADNLFLLKISYWLSV